MRCVSLVACLSYVLASFVCVVCCACSPYLVLMTFVEFRSLDDGVAFCCALTSLCTFVIAVVVVLLWCLVLMFVSFLFR